MAVVASAAVVAWADPGGNHANHNGDDNQGNQDQEGHFAACNNLTAGETLTVSGLTGHFANATAPRSDDDGLAPGGNATGTFTFKVSAVYLRGCSLSITGGSFTLNKTTYTVSGGSLVLNEGGRSGVGSGTTSGGSFLIRVDGLHGNSTSASVGAVGLDFQTGTSQFLVHLHSPMSDSGESGESGESD